MDLESISQETLEAVKKAQTAGILSSTGVFGYNLSGLVSLVPVNTPFQASVSRVQAPQGAKFSQWRALLNVNASQPNPFTVFDQAGALAQLDEQDMQAQFAALALGGTVTQDAIDLAKGYADARALATLNVMNQLLIGRDKAYAFGQRSALPVPTGLALTASTSGGQIPASTAVNVQVAARTGAGYFWGGSTAACTQVSVTTGAGSANSVTATWNWGRGAVAWDVYVEGFYLTTTTTTSVVITSVPASNQPVPASLPLLFQTAPTSVPTTDGSANSAAVDGFLATLACDYNSNGQLVTPGTATPSGATWINNNAGTLTVSGPSITQIDNLLLDIWNSVQLSPDSLNMSAQHAQDIATKTIGNGTVVNFINPTDSGAHGNIVAGGYAGTYINKAAGGVPVKIVVQPNWMPGHIVARTDTVPFPGSNIGRTLQVEMLRDLSDFSYGAARVAGAGGGPREDFELREVVSFQNKAPVAMGAIANIAAG